MTQKPSLLAGGFLKLTLDFDDGFFRRDGFLERRRFLDFGGEAGGALHGLAGDAVLGSQALGGGCAVIGDGLIQVTTA